MQLYSEDKSYKIYHGSMLDMLDVIEPNSIDSIVCDPPYCLTDLRKRWANATELGVSEGTQFGRLVKGFMGKEWDNDIAMQPETWRKCYDVLKSGGYLLAFGGTRTFHRIACAIEDAGFEIRDCIMWLYGSGFPKSMSISKAIESREKLGNAGTRNKRKIEQACDTEEYILKQTNNGAMGEIIETTRKEYIPDTDLAKQWQGWGTALKPAYEPIIVARKPCEGSITENVMKYGVGGINIDECRIYGDESITCHDTQKGTFAGKTQTMPKIRGNKLSFGQYDSPAERIEYTQHEGRFPSNVILTYDDSDYDEVCGDMPEGAKTGNRSLTSIQNCIQARKDKKGNSQCDIGGNIDHITEYTDSGSASRYFYCAKASKKDRDNGLDEFEEKYVTDGYERSNHETSHKFGSSSSSPRHNTHPTVKPVELMQYLVRLVTPTGGGYV